MGRMIQSEMWEDEFFTSMSMFDRLLWIGLITVCADDQGRMQDSAAMIRSNAFPVDDIPINMISEGLDRFYKEGKVVRYVVDKHKCIQIVNWWKHQKPQWAGKSLYPPCANWSDRMRYHTVKNEIVNTNWSGTGGFPADYIVPCIDSKVTGDVEGDVNVNVEGNDEYSPEKLPENKPSKPRFTKSKASTPKKQRDELIARFKEKTGLDYPEDVPASTLQKFWWSPASDMISYAGGVDEAWDILRQLIERFDDKGLNFADMNSFSKSFNGMIAQKKRGGGVKSFRPTEENDPYFDVVRR